LLLNGWGRGIGTFRVRWGNLRERDHLKDAGVNGRIISRLIFRKWDGGCALDWWIRKRTRSSTCKRVNEPSGSIKCGKFLD
jgi:hypothetical protein